MVSLWWVVVALVVGTCTGVLVMALLRIADGLPEPAATVTDAEELRMVSEGFTL